MDLWVQTRLDRTSMRTQLYHWLLHCNLQCECLLQNRRIYVSTHIVK